MRNKCNVLRRFYQSHHNRVFQRNDTYNRTRSGNYWNLYIPSYFSSNKLGNIAEHIYFYQEYHKLCMLSWGHIHHKDPVRKGYCNNMIWNLQGMMATTHTSLHRKGKKWRKKIFKRIITDERMCFICQSFKTRMEKTRRDNLIPVWYHLPWDFVKFYCRNCYRKEMTYYNKLLKNSVNNI
jgi:hypothetical protein